MSCPQSHQPRSLALVLATALAVMSGGCGLAGSTTGTVDDPDDTVQADTTLGSDTAPGSDAAAADTAQADTHAAQDTVAADTRDDTEAQDSQDTVATVTTASYVIVDTGQTACWNAQGQAGCSATGPLAGQDAQWRGVSPAFEDHGDGTVSDLRTGLMWVKEHGDKQLWLDAVADAEGFELAGYDDWRLPTIKELYSLIDFNGVTGFSADDATPYLDTDAFTFVYGDESAGERHIDAQYWSATEYVSTTMGGDRTAFGVNFADGRIKGYPVDGPGLTIGRFVKYVRDAPDYGLNDFETLAGETVTDHGTTLVWMRDDSGAFGAGDAGDGTLDWPSALNWCEGLDHAGHDDWRLPNAKELQSIVDYTRSPDTTQSAALDPVFGATPISNELGQADYGFYWTSTSHLDGPTPGTAAAYVSFGRAIGQLHGTTMDVHGAGAQRGDPKIGDRASYPQLGMGPQGDSRRVYNLARCVRGGGVTYDPNPPGGDVGVTAPGGGGTNPGGGGTDPNPGGGPRACTTQSECEQPGSCPPDAALGCTCAPAPGPGGGNVCLPACELDEDCPTPPGMDLICGAQGFCVPG